MECWEICGECFRQSTITDNNMFYIMTACFRLDSLDLKTERNSVENSSLFIHEYEGSASKS